MVAGQDDDGDWAFEDEPTRDDSRQAIPEAPARPETTAPHRTLNDILDQEVEAARARLDERRFLLAGLRLWQMQKGKHPALAEAIAIEFEAWLSLDENVRLIRATLDAA